MSKNISIVISFTKIFEHKDRVCLVRRTKSIKNVIIQHDVLEILEASDLFILPKAIHNFLHLSQYIIQNNLLPKRVYYLIVVD